MVGFLFFLFNFLSFQDMSSQVSFEYINFTTSTCQNLSENKKNNNITKKQQFSPPPQKSAVYCFS